MKKILLGTTGLFSAVLMFAGSASAETPKVTIGGFADFQVGVVSDDLDANQRSQGFRNDTEISIHVDGKSDTGLGYGAVVNLEADVSGDANNDGLNASATYLYLEGDWGHFELGSNTGAAESMKIDAATIASATGGISGVWAFFANGGSGASYITSPSLVLAHGSTLFAADQTQDNVNKITYYSPRFSGFQLGVSYAPDSTDRGQTVTRSNNDAFSNIFDVAASYQGEWDDLRFSAAATGEFGDADLNNVEDLAAWNVGLGLGYAGFSAAASYGDWDNSGQLNNSNIQSDYWTAGLAYNAAAFGASVTYMNSQVDMGTTQNEFDNLVFGVDYKLAPGLTPYAEVSLYDYNAPVGGIDNSGSVVIVGTQLSF